MNLKIEKLITFLSSHKNNINPKELKSFLINLNLLEEDLQPWADFDHPLQDGYGRKLVYAEDKFEIMVMSWMPNDFSAIHNHGYTQWGAVQVFGNASHYVYKMENNHIKLVEKQSFKPKDIVLVTNEFIHQMGNQTSTPYLTLHIYGTNEPREVITADSLIFEIENNRVVKTTGGAFFQLEEKEVDVLSDLKCNDEQTILEFASTILPKSKTFKTKQKKHILNWISEKKDILFKN
ncbi:MAG TPA: cysteine dioxygenase [Crocinitomix sp.]|nr:cysteine dioxygenase [Crocinitomix sp.]